MVSRVLAKGYLKNLKRNIVSVLDDQGLFVKKFTVDLEATYLPFLIHHALTDYTSTEALNIFLNNAVNFVSEDAVNHHQTIVREHLLREEEAKQEKERIAQATIERRKNRAEERAKRAEQKRRDAITEQITEYLIGPKSDSRERMLGQTISDLDSHGKDGGTVNLIGGLIGELLIFFSTIEELKLQEAEFEYLQPVAITQDTVAEILDKIIVEYCDGGFIEIGIASDTEGKIQAIDETLNLETLSANEAKKAEIEAVLKAQIKSYLTTYIRKNLETFGLREEILDWILTALVKSITNADEAYRKIKLVNATQGYRNRTPKLVALVECLPSGEGAKEFVVEKKMPAKDAKSSKGELHKGDQSKGSLAPNKQSAGKFTDSATTETEEVVLDPSQVDYDDRVTVFPQMHEEFRIFVTHTPVSVTLRRNLLVGLGEQYADLQPKVLEVLKKMNQKARFILESWCKTQADNFPILTFDMQ